MAEFRHLATARCGGGQASLAARLQAAETGGTTVEEAGSTAAEAGSTAAETESTAAEAGSTASEVGTEPFLAAVSVTGTTEWQQLDATAVVKFAALSMTHGLFPAG